MDLTGCISARKAASILEITPRWIKKMCEDPEKRSALGAIKKEVGQVEWFFLEESVKQFKETKRPEARGRPRKSKKK